MTEKHKPAGSFNEELIDDLSQFLNEQKLRFPKNEILKIDLHCHDHNSDVPDEILGRILNVPETWLSTKSLLSNLNKAECDVFTITNHNNARSCYDLQEAGVDVLTGAEFSCTVPDFNIGIHVLTYGLNKEDEKALSKLRRNLYSFLRYTFERDLPTIWAHPLYHYSANGIPSMDFFKKMTLIFERFEVLNGQRDTWQNMLIKSWVTGITPEKIDEFALQFGINPALYCKNPYQKFMSGGSDSHMGFFSGLTGTYLHVPDLLNRMKLSKPSELALESIKAGRMAPYGSHQNSEKLTVAFLDYVCQIALNSKDPGLMRILMHNGSLRDKITALFASNAFAELQRHKVTLGFVEVLHNSFLGKSAKFGKRFLVPRDYKGVFDDAQKIAEASKKSPKESVDIYRKSIFDINDKLNHLLFSRLSKKVSELKLEKKIENLGIDGVIEKLEIPSGIRNYIEKGTKNSKISGKTITSFLDGLSFPLLGSSIILAAHYTSARVMYSVRPLLQQFSEHFEKYEHPKRMLWLSDTFGDKNGVSTVLRSILDEINNRDLPIDLLICSNKIKPESHLKVIKPLAEFNVPFYQSQPLRIPSYLEIHELFLKGEYDRVMCSTEGPLGLAGLYLKNAYSVPAYFYMHTDWLMFAKKVLRLDRANVNRIRRLLRTFYKAFDTLFVLNTDQQKWLCSKEMGFSESKVHLTAHWADSYFRPIKSNKKLLLGITNDSPIILYAGRLSKEKGIMEIPEIAEKVRQEFPDAIFAFAGTGPAEKELKKEFPNALYLGWIKQDHLPHIFGVADLLLLPSKFDTFCCTAIEAMSCGLPVIAYNVKGPKDIIQDDKNGFLCNSRHDMADRIISYLKSTDKKAAYKSEALKRAKQYQAQSIMDELMKNVGLKEKS